MQSKKLSAKEYQDKLKELQEMEEMLKLKQGLPHLFGFPFYEWSRRIFESRNREIMLTSANQVGKSTTAIRKNIHLATSPSLWKDYWPNLRDGQLPGLFWYFYPTQGQATTEVEEKWQKGLLPCGEFKDHPQFGWQAEYYKGEIHALKFNTGVTIQFKSYAQKVKDLQGSSVYHLTLDEECPVQYLPELSARLNATDGYLLHVFTATLGQMHWKQTMEPVSEDEEKHKDALKIRASLYDSQFYEDGTPSPWTDEKIKRAIANCPTDAEVQRRVFGRFVKSEGLMYESFSQELNVTKPHPIPNTWSIYSAIDPGSGGKSGHPTGILFVAVNNECTKARVFRGWRGDGIPTTSEDILIKYRELKRGIREPTLQLYDFAAKDFFMIATRAGESFTQANKARDAGISLVNTLFKSGMLKIFSGDPELSKLVSELMTLSVDAKKTSAADDLIDPLRYICNAIPWNFEGFSLPEEERAQALKTPEARILTNTEARRLWVTDSLKTEKDITIEDELDLWSDLY